MMIHSLRPALAVGTALIAALLILFFGNRMKQSVRESITMAASVIMAGIVFRWYRQFFRETYIYRGFGL